MDDLNLKAKILIESLPYIKKFHGKIVVIKFGGSTMDDKEAEDCLIKDIVLMKLVGMNPVVVHGGGKDINEMLEKLNIEARFEKGLRITDAETIEVVEMVLSGKINKNIVKKFQVQGTEAVGISGKDCMTIIAGKKMPGGKDIGYVGEVEKVNTHLLSSLISNDIIPVIAPIGTDKEGNTYNINADTAASAVATALKAEKLVYMTDVDGIYSDFKDKSTHIQRISISDARELVDSGNISGGMIPKIENCIESMEKGINNIHIINGHIHHSLLFELFTDNGIGTMFSK